MNGAPASPWTAPARPTSRAIPSRRTSRPASVPATTPASTATTDAFVVKLDAAGTGLRYATFLGGSSWDDGYGIAVDSAGQAYVTGGTGSADFPANLGPGYDTSFNGSSDAFVVKLDAAGTSLRYATFLGGSDVDWGRGIAVDGAGQAYVIGDTESRDFPSAGGPGYDTSFNGGYRDAFVVKLDAAGTALRYATFLGGSGGDSGRDIAVDDAGEAYVTGKTESADFPASLGPGYDTSYKAASATLCRQAGRGRHRASSTQPSSAAALGTMAPASPWTAPARPTSRALPTRRTSRPAAARATTPAYNGGETMGRLRRQAGRDRHRAALRHLPRRQPR